MDVEARIRDLEARINILEEAFHNFIHIFRSVIEQLDYVESTQAYASDRLRDELSNARASLAEILRRV